MSMAVKHAPWSDYEVAALSTRQADKRVHPYTCPGDKDACQGHRELVPTRGGWVCQCGAYRQSWAVL